MAGSMRTFVTDGEEGETEAILKDQSVGPKSQPTLIFPRFEFERPGI